MKGTTNAPVLNPASRKSQISVSGVRGVTQLCGARAQLRKTRKETKGSNKRETRGKENTDESKKRTRNNYRVHRGSNL
ncbi:hypothetical protein NDU88_007325 [Pleurodeles waltl]|uniref:Uncharacterized protein n=1 Tax=Pleurodeles waltl TaxID=8319 RepID=A0AAV7NVW9_PLEWA|nr:hypothetical protein NDU88_007325 [Pleurodeles waltl]